MCFDSSASFENEAKEGQKSVRLWIKSINIFYCYLWKYIIFYIYKYMVFLFEIWFFTWLFI